MAKQDELILKDEDPKAEEATKTEVETKVEETKKPDFPPSVIPQKGLSGGYTIKEEVSKKGSRFRIYLSRSLWMRGNTPMDKGGCATEEEALKMAEDLGVYR